MFAHKYIHKNVLDPEEVRSRAEVNGYEDSATDIFSNKYIHEKQDISSRKDDGLGFARGFLFALMPSALLWVMILIFVRMVINIIYQ